MLIFQDGTMEEICSHAQAEYPKECCGIILGRRNGKQRIVYGAVQTGNMADVGRNTTHFEMDSLEIAKAELLADKENLEIIGFYHSHPDHEAIASNTDMHHMIEGYSYLIISVKNGICTGMRSFGKLLQTDMEAQEEKILIKEM